MGVVQILGKRQTIGTDTNFLVPPSRTALMEAAQLLHKPPGLLTVAARARSKHAHRGKEGFFGSVQGPPQTQNEETAAILTSIIEHAVWINIHKFGGLEENPVVEIRVKSGYGARWIADWSDYVPKDLEFRGFLEPQMDDGHEKQWRH